MPSTPAQYQRAKQRKQDAKQDAIHATMKEALAGNVKRLPHMTEIAEAFVEMCGGARAFAKILFDEVKAAEPGTVARQRVLAMIVDVWSEANKSAGRTEDLGILSTEDLQRELQAVLDLDHDEAQQADSASPEAAPGECAGADGALYLSAESDPTADASPAVATTARPVAAVAAVSGAPIVPAASSGGPRPGGGPPSARGVGPATD